MIQWCKLLLLAAAWPAAVSAQGVYDLLPLSGTMPDTNAVTQVAGRKIETTNTAAADLATYRRTAIAKLVDGPTAPLDSAAAFRLRYFPYAADLSFAAVFRPSSDSTLVNFPTSDGRARAYRAYGELIFFHRGAPYQLTVFEMPGLAAHPVYGDLLFLPFFDDSNGETTYGGGRYLDLARSALESGDYRLDFNRAYNPWCAYADGYSCPIPPLTNALPFAVHAGEAAFATDVDAVDVAVGL